MSEFPIERNIHYDKYPQTVLDVMQPRDPALKDRPGVIVIHGGGWVSGSKEASVELFCVPFLDRGFVVADVEYRLADAAIAPAAASDVLAAAKWFSDNAARYKVDPRKIIVTGGSAGGHLALLVGMVPASAGLGPATRIAAIVNFYGITDVADQLSGPNLRSYAQAWIPNLPDRMDLATRLSPLSYVRKELPPVLTLHGDADQTVPYEQGVRLTQALKAAGAKAELVTVAGGQHGFTKPQMDALWPQIFRFLKKYKVM